MCTKNESDSEDRCHQIYDNSIRLPIFKLSYRHRTRNRNKLDFLFLSSDFSSETFIGASYPFFLHKELSSLATLGNNMYI